MAHANWFTGEDDSRYDLLELYFRTTLTDQRRIEELESQKAALIATVKDLQEVVRLLCQDRLMDAMKLASTLKELPEDCHEL